MSVPFYALLSWCDAHITTWKHDKSNLLCRVYSPSNCNNKCCSFALTTIRRMDNFCGLCRPTFRTESRQTLRIAPNVLNENQAWNYTQRNISWQDHTETEWPSVAKRTLTLRFADEDLAYRSAFPPSQRRVTYLVFPGQFWREWSQ